MTLWETIAQAYKKLGFVEVSANIWQVRQEWESREEELVYHLSNYAVARKPCLIVHPVYYPREPYQ